MLGFDGPDQTRRVAARLAGLGHGPVSAENPYWTGIGAVTVEDPDGWRVVLVPGALTATAEASGELHIGWFDGDRTGVRSLFELAEDSADELGSYLHRGRVLVARIGSGTAAEIVGHLQLVDTGPARRS